MNIGSVNMESLQVGASTRVDYLQDLCGWTSDLGGVLVDVSEGW